MKINNRGCALCNATWGDYYSTVENISFFFCCSICAEKFRAIVNTIKEVNHISSIDSLHLEGTSSVRKYIAILDEMEFRGEVAFHGSEILDFSNQQVK